MSDIIYRYSGYLSIDSGRASALKELRLQPSFDVGLDYIEIIYTGRDANRFMVTELKKIATMIESATGEVTCAYQNESEDPKFEFYTIENGKLYLQRGTILRERSKSEC